MLQEKVLKLKEQYDSKKDAYDKYIEECSKSKELRDANIKALKEQIANVREIEGRKINEAVEQGAQAEEEQQRAHKEAMADLEKKYNQMKSKMSEMEKANANLEKEDRKTFVKVFQDYRNNMKDYDE